MPSPKQTPACSLPVVVGVTGHRDVAPDAMEALRSFIERIFDELVEFAAGPVQLVSPLAVGADQLVAEIAIARGFDCIAPLPMYPDEYEADFSDTESLATFRSLLGRCRWYVAPPLRATTDASPTREQAYLAAGHAVTSAAHVLIALWDGETGKPGGTADVVTCSLDPSRWIDHTDIDRVPDVDGCIVYHVETPREGGDALCAGKTRRLIPSAWATEVTEDVSNGVGVEVGQETIRELLLPLRTFNEDSARLPAPARANAEGRAGIEFLTTMGDASDDREPHEAIGPFATADELATRFRDLARKHVIGRLALLTTGLIAFESITGPWLPTWPRLVVVCGLVVMAMWGWPARGRDWDQRYLDYRALCECLRVYLHLRRAGIRHANPARYIRYHARRLDWVRLALQGLSRPLEEHRMVNLDELRTVQKYWLQYQHAYFAATAQREAGHQRRWMRTTLALLLGGCLLILYTVIRLITGFDTPESVSGLLLTAVSLLVGAGVCRAYVGYRAYEEHANRYSLMERAFRTADRAVDTALDQGEIDRAQRALGFVGELALQEVSDWLILHRERPAEVHPT